jgi:hypothetical protein
MAFFSGSLPPQAIRKQPQARYKRRKPTQAIAKSRTTIT